MSKPSSTPSSTRTNRSSHRKDDRLHELRAIAQGSHRHLGWAAQCAAWDAAVARMCARMKKESEAARLANKDFITYV
jgi:hypothetical protein